MADYTTLALVKESIDEPVDADSFIISKIMSASAAIDEFTGRRFDLDAEASGRVLSPQRRTVRERDGEHLLVDDIGELTGFTVEVGREPDWTDITTLVETEPTDALAKTEPVTSLLRLNAHFVTLPTQRIRITARWGWPAVPQVVQEAALIQTLRLLKRASTPEGIAGSAEFGQIRMARMDPDVQALIQHLIKPGIG